MKRPDFSISILAMNGLEVTRRCIESVLNGGGNFEILLTDNGSTDGTSEYFEWLPESDRRIKAIHYPINYGFSEPNNAALSGALGKYFVCLNNDTEVPSGWLSKLEQPFKDFPTAAISGASGSCCSLKAPYPSFHGSPGPDLEYIEGSCLCIPTALAREVTLFAPYLKFAYSEDVDLSLRMRARGRTIHAADFSIVHHRQHTARNIPNIHEIQMANHAVMIRRWGNYLRFKKLNLPFVIKRTGAIGDVLLTTPLIAEIKKQNPQSEIFVETAYPAIFKNNPNVKEAAKEFPNVRRWACEINLDMSYENMPETSIQEAYFKTANIIGKPGRPELFPDDATAKSCQESFGDKQWVAVHPGPSTWRGKDWPFDRWEKVCRRLADKGWRVLLVGTPGPSLPNYLDLRGKTDFQTLSAVLRCCKLFVGIDSFPIHCAQAVGCPVVGLFGATLPEFILTGDYAAVCGTAPCAGERHRVSGKTYTACEGTCMESISVEQVMEAVP
jgi:ADP-heptose:LPS heptosyltransferase/GT2 family glycosyltransferase